MDSSTIATTAATATATAAIDAARKRQEERYQKHLLEQEAVQATQAAKEATEALQAAQRTAQEAAQEASQKAAQVALEAQAACRQKVLQTIRKYNGFTPIDWAATRLQRFLRTRQSHPKLSEPSEPVVVVDGVAYKFYSEASTLFDARAPPFDSPHGHSVYVAVLMKIQNSANFASPDNQLSVFHQVVFFLSCISRDIRPDVGLLFGVFELNVINQMMSLNLSDYPKLSRNIRLLNLLLNGQVPDWFFQHFPPGTNLEDFVDFFRQEVLSEMERIRSSQALLAETMWQPNPDDELQCTNCQQHHLAKNMHKQPRGSFFFCSNCAPLAGIFPLGYFEDDDDF
jgi:hypothetical protein